MNKMYLLFPEILFLANTAATATTIDESPNVVVHLLSEQKELNAELLRICQLQKRLLDEQSSMIVEMLEEMGR